VSKLITVYGGTGTVGSAFCKRYDEQVNLMWRSRVYSHIPGPILYLISTTHNYNVFDQPHLDVDTNLTWLIEVLESWRKNHPDEVFNFVSSWFVYGDGYEVTAAHEINPCNPKGWYSITKRCAEQMLISYCQTYNLKYRILRLGNVIAPNDQKVSARKNALQYLINQMKEGKEIEIYEGGDFYRNYMHVNDTVEAIKLVMDQGALNTIYNIGHPKNVKFMDLLIYAKKELKYNLDFKFIPQKDFHKVVQTKSFKMDTTRLQSLGFEPKLSIHAALDTCIYHK
jgi:nucleoside-diphosphate-sugar epimerase